MKENKIKDFGEKIGDARKDFYTRSGYTPLQQNPNVRLRNLWISPNWQQKVADGEDIDLVFFKKEARRLLPKKPRYSRYQDAEAAEKDYINTVLKVKETVMQMKDFNDVEKFCSNSYFRQVYALEGIELYKGTADEIKSKIQSDIDACGGYVKGTKKQRKPAWSNPYTRNLVRTGFNYRTGNVTGDDFLKIFKIRGGEFGNWETDPERQEHLNFAYDSLKNLALALRIKDSSVSLGNDLALAFGSRGRGSAAAHYEPFHNVINLTKKNGAGCLAHEWIHALDTYVSSYLELPEYEEVKDRYYNLVDTINSAEKYLSDAVYLDANYSNRGHKYFHSMCELIARAGSSWIEDRLLEDGIVDDYLCSPEKEDVPKDTVTTYPRKKERIAISKAFDELIEAMRFANLI